MTDQDCADRRSALTLVPVSRETEARLALYVERLRAWQHIKNLVGPSTLDQVWTRHIADSAQLVALAPDALRWVDLGSGAGFPGLVIAMMLAGTPRAQVDLVESNARKCAFLRDVIRTTGAPARVHNARVEDVIPGLGPEVEVVTSRALAPWPALVVMSRSLIDAGAIGLFLTGREPAAAPLPGGCEVATVPSRTDPHARIMRVVRQTTVDRRAGNADSR